MANVKICIKPESVWSYYEQHSCELTERMDVIAETSFDDANTKCYLFLTEDSNKPFITLESMNEILDSSHLEKGNYMECVNLLLKKLGDLA